MSVERTERQYPYALASIVAYALYALAHVRPKQPEVRTMLFALMVALITWSATTNDRIRPTASKGYVLFRYVLFSVLCLALAAVKAAGTDLKDDWFFIGGAALLATALRVVVLPTEAN